MKPKIVLVPLDGSRLTEEALAPATGFAREGAAVEAAYSTLIRYPIGDESDA